MRVDWEQGTRGFVRLFDPVSGLRSSVVVPLSNRTTAADIW